MANRFPRLFDADVSHKGIKRISADEDIALSTVLMRRARIRLSAPDCLRTLSI